MAAIEDLPPQLTSFIGREKELDDVISRLSSNRLLTLVGPGGSGKTRLSLEVAARAGEQFPDGVWFVPLDTIADPELVVQTVVAAVGIRQDGRTIRNLAGALLDRLRSAHALLILDNCEHLVDECALLVNELLKACADLHVLATSRQALSVEGENTWPIPSLDVPETIGTHSVDELGKYAAVRLFKERAGRSHPGFELTTENIEAVVQLCKQLDGMPLAIELAAARVNVLSAEQIVARLNERFRLFISSSQTTRPRQHTLTALMDWSYELLSDRERALLRRLSVFSGPFGLEAVTAVAGENHDEFETIDLMAKLCDKSLVTMKVLNHEAQYRLLETIRQYAFAKLETEGETTEAKNRHLDWYLNLARSAQAGLLSADQGVWLNKLETEHENIRAALDYAIRGKQDPNSALQISGMVWRFWDMRGYMNEGRRWLEDALAMEGDTDPIIRARALTAAGNLAINMGDLEYAAAVLTEGLRLRREAGDERAAAGSLSNLGVIARARGEYKEAERLYTESLEIFRRLGSEGTAASVLDNLGFLAQTQGEYDRAETLYLEAVALSRKIGDEQGIAIALNNLGEVSQAKGDYDQAEDYYNQALRVCDSLQDKIGTIGVMNNIAGLNVVRGKTAKASELYRAALEVAGLLNHVPSIAESIEGLALAEAPQNYDRAARLMGASMSMRDRIGAPVAPNERVEYEKQIEKIRAGVGARFDRLLAAGKALTQEQAVALADAKPNEVQGGAVAPSPRSPKEVEKIIKEYGLTKREIEVLRLIAQANSDAQVGDTLKLSTRTIHSHTQRIYNKIGVNSRAAATKWATENGIV